MAVKIYIDPKRDNYWAGGVLIGNFTIYQSVAKQAVKDKQKPEEILKTLKDALAKKVFEGSLGPDGSLTYGEPVAVTARWDQIGK